MFFKAGEQKVERCFRKTSGLKIAKKSLHGSEVLPRPLDNQGVLRILKLPYFSASQ
jgi:hypothetical protein